MRTSQYLGAAALGLITWAGAPSAAQAYTPYRNFSHPVYRAPYTGNRPVVPYRAPVYTPYHSAYLRAYHGYPAHLPAYQGNLRRAYYSNPYRFHRFYNPYFPIYSSGGGGGSTDSCNNGGDGGS